jgi:hypothetical protein
MRPRSYCHSEKISLPPMHAAIWMAGSSDEQPALSRFAP